ncbi:MAG: nucleotidyl transferase AbiEii/AbiGii toxin family protein [Campylobacterales bacterium]|nr:nucleotidyl transferase AbiEii/AbiGii toxin family protein [Campylobacterales bacterium]
MLEKTKHTLEILAQDDLFKNNDIRFVGGTALSYLIKHRLSEDLDFATLSLEVDYITQTMEKYGARRVKLNNTLIDNAKNDGENIDYSYLVFNLDGVKIEFFIPPFNIFEDEVWTKDQYHHYENTNLKISSLDTIFYMKTMAFWNRKKYRDLFDIYYILTNKLYDSKLFIEKYLQYNITYTTKHLYEKIQSKNEFYLKETDEGLHTLVDVPRTYEYYRKEIENIIHQVYLDEIYS